MFARSDIHAPLDHVATAAGVGPGTLYRHFASRAELWTAVLEEPLREHLGVIDRALQDPDPATGFRRFVLETCEIDAREDGYADLMNTRFEAIPELQELRTRIQWGITRIVARAHSAGAIRPDITAEDLYFVTASNAAIAAATRAIAPDAWRRNAALYLDAFTARNAEALPSPALTVPQLEAIVRPSPAVDPRRGGAEGSAPTRRTKGTG